MKPIEHKKKLQIDKKKNTKLNWKNKFIFNFDLFF
jgi:hypothetical protein